MGNQVYKYILFSVADSMWALPLSDSSQFFSGGDVAAIPNVDKRIRGLVYHNGQIVTVIDTRALLLLAPAGVNDKNNRLLFSFKDDYYALMVDDVGDTVKTDKVFIDKHSRILDKYIKLNQQKIYIVEPAEIFKAINLYD